MLNLNLTKNDIGYLRLLLDIESYEFKTEKNCGKTQNEQIINGHDYDEVYTENN